MVTGVGVVETIDWGAGHRRGNPADALVFPAKINKMDTFRGAASIEVFSRIGIIETIHVDRLGLGCFHRS